MSSARDFFTPFITALNEHDFATLEELVHHDVVSESPQSGERAQGFAALRREMESYPGGTPTTDLEQTRLVDDDDRWVITPAYTVIPLASTPMGRTGTSSA